MESDKPRVISFHAETSTDFEKPRVSIPTTRAVVGLANVLFNTNTLSRSVSSCSIPIRAPLTIDEDDSSSLNDERYSATSDVSSYGRRLDSEADDELEYASGDADDETALETGGIRAHTPLEEDPDGETEPDNEFSGGSVIYRPFAGDIDEETSVNQFSFSEEESESSDNVDSVSESEVSEADRDNMKAKVVIPRAMLSLDDDEFDEILGSDDEETALVRVVNTQGDIEVKLEDNELLVEDMEMIDKPECSDSVMDEFVSMEEELVREHTLVEEQNLVVTPGAFSNCMVENEGNAVTANMEFDETFESVIEKEVVERGIDSLMKPSDEGVEDMAPEVSMEEEHTLVEEQSLLVTSGAFSDCIVEDDGNTEMANMGFDETFNPVIEEEMVERGIDMDDVGGDTHEIDSLMKPSDEGVEYKAPEVEKLGMTNKAECSVFVTPELISSQEDKVLAKFSGESLETIDENSLGVALGDCNEFPVESEGNIADANRGSDENSCSLFEQRADQESSRKITNDGVTCESNATLIPVGGSISLESRELDDEHTRDIINKAKDYWENDYCTSEPETGISSGTFQLIPTLNSLKAKNLEVSRGKQLSLCDENGGSSSRSSLQKACESVETEEQVSEQNNEDSEPNLSSVSIEDTQLLSVKDVDGAMPSNSYVSADERIENEMQMADLIHDHTVLELDEYEETSDSTLPEGSLKLLTLCCAVKYYSKADSSQKHNTLIEKSDLFRSKLDSNHEILWEEQKSQECLEQDMNLVKNQPKDEVRHEKSDFGCIRIRRGRFGIQVKKFIIYLDVSGLNTGFSINNRDYKKSFYSEKHEKEEGKISVRMRGSSMAVLGLIPVLMSVLSSVYGGK